jgi:hypothetical protein
MKLFWTNCKNGFINLKTLNLNDPHFDNMIGVYIIWHGGQYPAVVRIGQGIIKDRLAKHREDKEILAYQEYGLYVTWASVPREFLDGVERFLGNITKPKVGSLFPDVVPLTVNLPW